MTWTLIDVVERNKAHPHSFRIPAESERYGLQPRFFAKLIFATEEFPAGRAVGAAAAERMWVQVDTALDETRSAYLGHLRSTPPPFLGLQKGDPITFGPEHVAGIEAPE